MSHSVVRFHTPIARRAVSTLAAAGVLLALAGCAAPTTADSAPITGPDLVPASPSTMADALELTDAWVKAVDEGMTGAFAALANPTDADVELVAVATPASAMAELHEVVTVDGAPVMRQIDGGIVIETGGERTLAPGGDHLMLMGITEALLPGDTVPITLTFADDSSVTVDFAVREFSGANEDYHGDE